ncbi:hypothetical protein [Acinetobacter sp.]|uniref:hypothetical protein n=1 Tax=Acinetobacter sp. TaxID=472 RepID=UPI003D05BF12
MDTQTLKTTGSYAGNFAPIAGAVVGQAAGLPVTDILFQNPIHGVAAGIMTKTWHKNGLQFGGIWGYKTLFTGLTGKASHLSVGHMMLGAVEGFGKAAVKAGWHNTFTLGAQHARKLGLAGMLSGAENADDIATKGAKGFAKFARVAGGLGDDILDDGIMKVVAGDGQKAVTRHFAKYVTGAMLSTSKLAMWGGRAFSIYGWGQLLAMPLVSGTKHFGKAMAKNMGGIHSLLMNNRFKMGSGYLSDSFRTQQAATERQRAVQAIYMSKINPGNRAFGNEAQMYHR